MVAEALRVDINLSPPREMSLPPSVELALYRYQITKVNDFDDLQRSPASANVMTIPPVLQGYAPRHAAAYTVPDTIFYTHTKLPASLSWYDNLVRLLNAKTT